MAIIMMIFVVNSLYTGSLAPLNSSGRMLYAMSRDGIAPNYFSGIHQKFRTPHISLVFLAVIGILISLAAGLIFGPFNGFLYLVTASAVALFIGHMMTDASLPLEYKRIKEFAISKHAIVPAVSFVFLIIGIYYSFFPITYPEDISIITAIVFMVVSAVVLKIYINKHKEVKDKIGSTPIE